MSGTCLARTLKDQPPSPRRNEIIIYIFQIHNNEAFTIQAIIQNVTENLWSSPATTKTSVQSNIFKDHKDDRTGKLVFGTFQSSSLCPFCNIDEWICWVCHNSWQDGSSSYPINEQLWQNPLSWRFLWVCLAIECNYHRGGADKGVPSKTATGGCENVNQGDQNL